MGYNKRYKKRRSSSGYGSTISDMASIANFFGPKGALIVGIAGFSFFYFIVPWALVAWADHNKAKMIGQHADIFARLLDEVFVKRFIHPSEWMGIAVLIIGMAIACWKALTPAKIDRSDERQLAGLGKLLSRLLD
jgi:hypothetical protein